VINALELIRAGDFKKYTEDPQYAEFLLDQIKYRGVQIFSVGKFLSVDTDAFRMAT